MRLHKILVRPLAALAGLAVAAAPGVWNVPAVHAQSTAPRFEAASVKPWVPGSGLHLEQCAGDRFILSGLRFGNVLQWAYDLQGDAGQEFLQRVPESIRGKSYEIQAKAESPITSESQCRLMVQALLADRFNLTFHYEERDTELSDLVVARGGLKLEKALSTDEGTDVNIVVNGLLAYTQPPITDPNERTHTKGMTMQELAQRLPTTDARPVADKTGLQGRYKIDLRYSTLLPADGQDAPSDPPLDVALAKLGLRLEKHKGSVKVPVLDHIEAPDSN